MDIRSRTIAIFDDDEDLLTIFRFLFESEGFQVHLFRECDHVVDKVRQILPDIILMDNWIPGTGGEVAVKSLKAQPDLSSIPVIYVSANNDIREIAQRAGANAFMAKPFEFNDLLTLAAGLLGQKEYTAGQLQ